MYRLERIPGAETRHGRVLIAGSILAAGLLGTVAVAQPVRVEPQIEPFMAQKVAFNPTNSHEILIVEGDGRVSLWNVANPRRHERRTTIYTVAADALFTIDGATIVTAGANGFLRRFDRAGERIWKSRERHRGPVYSVALFQDPERERELLVSSGGDGAVYSWNLADGSRIRKVLESETVGFSKVVFEPRDGRRLALAGRDGTIRLQAFDGTSRAELASAHQGAVSSLAFAPDASWLASAGRDGRVRLWDLAATNSDGTPAEKSFAGPAEDASAVAVAGDGDLLAIGGADGRLRLWTVDGTALGESLVAHEGRVSSLVFAPGEELLASLGEDGHLRLWTLEFHARGETFAEFESDTLDVAFSPDGQRIASADEEGTIRLWDLDGSPYGEPFLGHEDWANAVTFSPDGEVVASASDDGTVRLWNLDGSPRREPLTGEDDFFSDVSFSPDGRLLASTGEDGEIRLWSVEGVRLEEAPGGASVVEHGSDFTSVAFSPNGRLLASAGGETVRLWSVDGTRLRSSDEGPVLEGEWEDSFLFVAFSPDGRHVAAVSAAGRVLLWGLGGSRRGQILEGQEGLEVFALAFSPDGRRLIASSDRGVGQIWTLTPMARQSREISSVVSAAAFSVKGDLFALIGEDGALRLWSFDGTPRGEPFEGLNVNSAAFSPDGRLMVTAGEEGAALWDLEGPSPSKTILSTADRSANAAAFSLDGALMAVSSGARVLLWDRDGTPRDFPAAHDRGGIMDLAFSPDGRLLATGGTDSTVRLWNPDGSLHGSPLEGFEGWVTSVSFSPDGELFAAASTHISKRIGTLRLFELDGDPQPLPFGGDGLAVVSTSFSPDGRALVFSTLYGTLHRWELDGAVRSGEMVFPFFALHVGYRDETLFALSPAGRITLFSEDFEPEVRFFLTPEGGLAVTGDGWFSGSANLLGQVRHFTAVDAPALDPERAFTRYHSPEQIAAAVRGRSPWETLWARVVATARRLETWHEQLEWWQKLGFWPTAGYTLLTLMLSCGWLLRPAVLAHLAMPSRDKGELPPFKSVAATMSLVRWLGGSRRALDAWLRRHDEELHQRSFAGRDSVADRERYVDLGHAESAEEWLGEAVAGRPAHGWISGPGGAGKSTLAFRLARTRREQGGAHPVLPIVVEEDWPGTLLDHLGERLHVGDRRPSESTVRKLAYAGRLTVVIDGLSERRDPAAAEEVSALASSGAIRQLLVTTRSAEEPPGGFAALEVGPLELDHLSSFVRQYAADADPAPIEKALRDFARGEPLRPLFARVAIESYRDRGSLAGSIPELISDYVGALHRPGGDALVLADFLRAARVAAKACVLGELAPRSVSEDELRGHLKAQSVPFRNANGKAVPGSKVLDELVEAGLLESAVERMHKRLRFANEPIAEYLVAMAVFAEGEEALADLRQRVAQRGPRAGGLAEALQHVAGKV